MDGGKGAGRVSVACRSPGSGVLLWIAEGPLLLAGLSGYKSRDVHFMLFPAVPETGPSSPGMGWDIPARQESAELERPRLSMNLLFPSHLSTCSLQPPFTCRSAVILKPRCTEKLPGNPIKRQIPRSHSRATELKLLGIGPELGWFSQVPRTRNFQCYNSEGFGQTGMSCSPDDLLSPSPVSSKLPSEYHGYPSLILCDAH